MPLTEQQALDLTDGFDALDDQRKAQATQLLSEYTRTQEMYGLPAFPSLLKKADEEESAFRSMFEDIGNVDLVEPRAAKAAKQSTDPNGIRMMLANVKFISRYTGMSENDVLSGYEGMMPAFSAKMFGKDIADDSAFFAAASEHITKQKKQEEVLRGARDASLIAASDVAITANKALQEWKVKNPDASEEHTKAFLEAYNDMSSKLPGPMFRGNKTTTQAINDFVSGKHTPEDIDTLLDLPAKQRNALFAAMFARAEKEGEKVPEGELNKTVPGQTAKAFIRTLADGVSGGILDDTFVEGVKAATKGLVSTEVQNIASVEDARKFVKEQVRIKDMQMAAQMGGFQPLDPTRSLPESRKLTAAEKKLVDAELARAKLGIQLSRTLRQLEHTADPVKSALASGTGSSLALLGVSALPGGVALSTIGYANSEYNKLKMENPAMSDGVAQAISVPSALAMSALDRLNVSFLTGKLPSVRNLINKGVGSTLATKLVKDGLTVYGFENIIEGVQDASSAIVQEIESRISADVPELDGKLELMKWANGRADVAIGMIPLTLLGVGLARVSDISNADELMSDVNSLRRHGVQDADIFAIDEAKTLEQKEAALQEAFTRRDPEVAKAAGANEQTVTQINAEKHLQVLMDRGVVPKFSRSQDDGWVVEMPDGETHEAKTWEEAKSVAAQHFVDLENSDIDLVGQLADLFLSQDTRVSEMVSMDTAERNIEDDVAEGVITPEQAAQKVEVAAAKYGVAPDKAADVIGAVLGRNTIEMNNLVAQSVSRLWKGSSTITLTEEVVEGRFKLWLTEDNGKFAKEREQEARAWIATAEQATGEKFLHNDDLVEAVSSIVAADVLGIRRNGTRVIAGVITKGMRAVAAKSVRNGRFATFLAAWRELFGQVLRHAHALVKAKKAGKLTDGHDAFVDKLLGVDTQTQHMNAVAAEAVEQTGVEVSEKETSYSLAPRAFHAAVDTELEKFLRDPEKRAAIYGKARINVAKASLNLRSVAAHMAKVQGKTDELDALLEEREKFHNMEMGRLALLKKVKARVSKVKDADGNVIEVLEPVDPVQTIKDEMNTRLKQMKHDGETDEDIAQERQGFMVRIEAARKHDMEMRNQEFMGEVELAETEHMRWLSEAEKDHDAELEMLAVSLQAQLATVQKGGITKLREQNAKLVKKEEARWSKEKAGMEAARDLQHQAAKLRFEGKQREAEAKRKDAIDSMMENEKLRWALEKQRLTLKHQIAVEKMNSNEALNKQRSDLQAVSKILDAIVMAFPPKLRGAVGGFTQMAGATTNEAMMKHLQKKVLKLDAALEKHLKEYFTDKIEKLVASALRSDKKGDAPSSKTGATTHDIFKAVRTVIDLDAAELQKYLNNVEADMLNAVDAETGYYLEIVYQVAQLVGNTAKQNAASLESGYLALSGLFKNSSELWKADREARMAPRKMRRDLLLSGALALGDKNRRGPSKLTMLNLDSFASVMQRLFGDNNSAALAIIDMERAAAYADEDGRYFLNELVNNKLEELGRKSGRNADQMLHDLMQPSMVVSTPVNTVDGPKTKLSQMEAGSLMLGWQQSDVRALWEEHGMTEKVIEEIRGNMTSEAIELMSFISEEYSKEWAELNPYYVERHGVNIPRNPFYSPSAREGDVAGHRNDRVGPDGKPSASRRRVTDPGFFNTRVATTKARPLVTDMLSSFLSHRREAIYWKSYFDVAKEIEGITNSVEMRDALKNVAGPDGLETLAKFQEQFAQDGLMDAAASLAITSFGNKILGSASAAAILGRTGTLLIQSTQLGAALAHMPTGAYVSRMGGLLLGELNFSDALNSEFIQRRVRTMPPLVREAMMGLGADSPAMFRKHLQFFGKVLGFTDAFFTAGTYAIVLDYKKQEGAGMGMSGADLDKWAHNETERAVEETAQPIRAATRSAYELASMGNPLVRNAWAFSTNQRMMASLFAKAIRQAKDNPDRLMRVAFFTLAINGVMSHVLRSAWRELRGDDSKEKWSPKALLMATLGGFATGVPGAGILFGEESNLLSSVPRSYSAIKRLSEGEWELDAQTVGDIESLIQGMSVVHPDLAAISAMSHLPADVVKIIDNLTNSK